MKVIYHSDRVKAIADIIHSCHLIPKEDSSEYWNNTYVWTNDMLRKALSFVPQRFKYRKDGLEAWNPELRNFVRIYSKDFAKYEIESIPAGYLLYRGREVRNINGAEKYFKA